MSQKAIIAIAASSILVVVVALLLLFNIGNIRHGFAKSTNPVMDVNWKVVSNNGSKLVLRLQIRCKTPGIHRLNSADFYYEYDPRYMSSPTFTMAPMFDPAKDGNGVFSLAKVADFGLGGFKTESYNQMVLTIASVTGTSGAIVSTGNWIDVADIAWNLSSTIGTAWIDWDMESKTQDNNTLTGLFETNLTYFDKGSGWDTPFKISTRPLGITELSAQVVNKETELTWFTTYEFNTDYFTVERSQDGTHFQTLLKKPGFGNSDKKQTYTDQDAKPLTGTSYYRLLQTDLSGKTDTLNTVSVTNNVTEAAPSEEFAIISISPTNFNDYTIATYKVPSNGSAIFTVTSTDGKSISTESVEATQGTNTYRINNTANWKPGLYILNLSFNGKSTFGKMIKQ